MGMRPFPNPPRLGARLVGLASGVVAFLLLFPSLLLINVIQMASLLLLPVSRRAFRAVNRWAANTWWGWCVWVSSGFYGVRLEVTGDVVPPRENAILVVNHQEMSDITFLFFFARSKFEALVESRRR